MTVQEIADLASRTDTRIADEMLRACAIWSYESGIPISVPKERIARAETRRIEQAQ
ncbi:MAG: hypothetical protein IKF14_18300 [Atopobiaceae bacterium]|nr:hypothetical protein [Atopobiaceae bacterium]MBR3161041.1 hypothetical protein [Atopobiaceae bacterium]